MAASKPSRKALANVVSLEEARVERLGRAEDLDAPEGASPEAAGPQLLRALESGRKVLLTAGEGREAIEVHDPSGQVEVTIELTAAGPVVRLSSARLELASTKEIVMRGEKLDIETEDGARIHTRGIATVSGRETRVGAQGDVRLKGSRIFLN